MSGRLGRKAGEEDEGEGDDAKPGGMLLCHSFSTRLLMCVHRLYLFFRNATRRAAC